MPTLEISQAKLDFVKKAEEYFDTSVDKYGSYGDYGKNKK